MKSIFDIQICLRTIYLRSFRRQIEISNMRATQHEYTLHYISFVQDALENATTRKKNDYLNFCSF